jgi:hypothetical protein
MKGNGFRIFGLFVSFICFFGLILLLWFDLIGTDITENRNKTNDNINYVNDNIYLEDDEMKVKDGKTFEGYLGNDGYMLKVDVSKDFKKSDVTSYTKGLLIGKTSYVLKINDVTKNIAYFDIKYSRFYSTNSTLLESMGLTSFEYENLVGIVKTIVKDFILILYYFFIYFTLMYLIVIILISIIKIKYKNVSNLKVTMFDKLFIVSTFLGLITSYMYVNFLHYYWIWIVLFFVIIVTVSILVDKELNDLYKRRKYKYGN